MTSPKIFLFQFVPFMMEYNRAKFHQHRTMSSKVIKGGWNPPPPPSISGWKQPRAIRVKGNRKIGIKLSFKGKGKEGLKFSVNREGNEGIRLSFKGKGKEGIRLSLTGKGKCGIRLSFKRKEKEGIILSFKGKGTAVWNGELKPCLTARIIFLFKAINMHPIKNLFSSSLYRF